MNIAQSHICHPAKESEYYTASDLRRVISQFGFAISYPVGVSMRPLIWHNQHYVVISRLAGEPHIGDILAFEQIRKKKTAYIVHRLIGVECVDGDTVYVMRGDNCLGCERIRKEDIIGIVTEVYRNGRWRPWHAISKKHFTMADRIYLLYVQTEKKTRRIRWFFHKLRVTLSLVKHSALKTCSRSKLL